MCPLIYQHEFRASSLSLVQGFDCGNEPWCNDVNDWIKITGESECATSCIGNPKRYCRVWLYSSEPEISEKTLVGYSSLGLSTWPLSAGKTKIGTIPNFGVDSRFRGKKHDADETFATAMFRDLLSLSHLHLPNEINSLGLYVHPRNQSGIKFWTRCGFVNIDRMYKDGDIEYQGMIAQFR